ncbi:hypothetical protein Bca4012_094693 [Brassica carinata]
MITIISKPGGNNEGDFDNDDDHTTYEDLIEDQHLSLQPEQHVQTEQPAQSEEHVQHLRRSSCQPTYLLDYVLQSKEECERLLLSKNNEPSNFKEAKDLKEWRDACKEEIVSINKNKIWFQVDKPIHIKVIGLKWVFKIKKDADGTIDMFKS